MRIIYYATEHKRVWFKEWFTFKFVEVSIGKFLAYKERNCYVICMSWVELWNYNTNRENMSENFFIKVYWVQISYEVENGSLWTKNKIISLYQTTNLLKTWFLFLVCKKGQKEDKKEFVTTSVGIKVTIIFMQKYLSNC